MYALGPCPPEAVTRSESDRHFKFFDLSLFFPVALFGSVLTTRFSRPSAIGLNSFSDLQRRLVIVLLHLSLIGPVVGTFYVIF